MRITKLFLLVIFIAKIFGFDTAIAKNDAITTDSRIRTFIYNKNDIFRVVIHYNYQTSIEFEDGENIETISSGNNYAWQLTPAKNRIFIKPLEENILTNMTIITNRRTYYLEVQSKPYTNSFDDELIYVVRFHIPKKEDAKSKVEAKRSVVNEFSSNFELYNFNFKIKGKEELKPINIYDDGTNTYLHFSRNVDLKEVKVKIFNNNKRDGKGKSQNCRRLSYYF